MKKVIIVFLSIIGLFCVASCARINSPKTPIDAIKDVYGDEQFKISFYAESLEEPIADIYYSANNMPILPTPEKVGYIFSGWFFDPGLTSPCDVSNGDLYWKMCDLTLYASWNKESIVNNGIYDIEFKTKIMEETIALGPLADKYGWRKFNEDIIAEETYIEKNTLGTWLRIQYDSHEKGAIFEETELATQAYTVKSLGVNRISKELSIFDRTSTVQTLYYDISDLDLGSPIMLYIEYYNWKAELSDGEIRSQCSAFYQVEFEITRFIGFSQSFVNTDKVLENGYYLVPTHYTELNKAAAVLDVFHPVYSYILAENGHYTLIKQLSTYNADIPNLTSSDYVRRQTGYARDFTYFLTEQDNVLTDEQLEDSTIYVPELLNASSYGTLTYEFHSDTGKYYYSLDIGTSLDKDIILYGGSTGAMEQMFDMPFGYRRLCIDYNSMVKITDCDYKPLEGDSYSYSKQVPFYSGYPENDFATNNTVYDTLKKYAYAVNMVNLFFSSHTNAENVENVFDSKIVVSPTPETKLMGNVSDMRYNLSYFNISYEAYGYDLFSDGDLYSSGISYLSLMTTASTNYECKEVDIGKTLEIGENVNLLSLYQEFVYKEVKEKNLNWQAYNVLSNGKVDFSSPIQLEKNFIFNTNVAIYFTAEYDTGTRNSLVTLMQSDEINYEILDDNWAYDQHEKIWINNSRYVLNEEVIIPEIVYSSLDNDYSIRSLKKYEDDENFTTNFLQVALWKYQNGIYTRIFSNYKSDSGTNCFKMIERKMRITCQLMNRFGEWEEVKLEYRANNLGNYYIIDDDERVQSSDFTYTDGKRDKINYSRKDSYILNQASDVALIPDYYSMYIQENDNNYALNMDFSFATIYLRNDTFTVYSKDEIWKLIKDAPYALVTLNYISTYGDQAIANAIYNFNVDSKNISEYDFIDDKSVIFTGVELELERAKLFSSDNIILGRGTYYIYFASGDNYVLVTKDNYEMETNSFGSFITFLKEGTYLITQVFSFTIDEFGNPVFAVYDPNDENTRKSIGLCQKIEVHSDSSDITLTYVTDKKHPFDLDKIDPSLLMEDDNYFYYTVTLSMAENNISLDYTYFVSSKSRLYGWSSKNDISGRLFNAGAAIGKLGVKLSTLNPIIYALWDEGITINAYYDMDDKDSELMGSVTFYRENNGSYSNYLVRLFEFRQFYHFPSGYEHIGWRADKPVFVEGYGSSAVYNYTSDFDFNNSFNVKEEFVLWIVVKKKIDVSYQAKDENGNDLILSSVISASRNLLEDDTLANQISESKLAQLNSVSCIDSTKEFKYWAVYVEGKYIQIDLENDPLLLTYITSSNRIVLYAIFGDKVR